MAVTGAKAVVGDPAIVQRESAIKKYAGHLRGYFGAIIGNIENNAGEFYENISVSDCYKHILF